MRSSAETQGPYGEVRADRWPPPCLGEGQVGDAAPRRREADRQGPRRCRSPVACVDHGIARDPLSSPAPAWTGGREISGEPVRERRPVPTESCSAADGFAGQIQIPGLLTHALCQESWIPHERLTVSEAATFRLRRHEPGRHRPSPLFSVADVPSRSRSPAATADTPRPGSPLEPEKMRPGLVRPQGDG